MKITSAIVLSSFPLCVMAALVAFVIAYEGHMKLKMASRKKALREAGRMAAVAFFAFSLLLFAVSWLLKFIL